MFVYGLDDDDHVEARVWIVARMVLAGPWEDRKVPSTLKGRDEMRWKPLGSSVTDSTAIRHFTFLLKLVCGDKMGDAEDKIMVMGEEDRPRFPPNRWLRLVHPLGPRRVPFGGCSGAMVPVTYAFQCLPLA